MISELDYEGMRAEKARRSLHSFVEQAWHLVEPDVEFRTNWHIRALCGLLERVTAGEIKQLIVNVPPGCMKSLLVSVFWPAWEWGPRRSPGLRYLTASYGGHLTIRDNLRVRAIITSPWYRQHFPVVLVGDQNAKERFNTAKGGWRIATSVGGVGTGEHPDRVIIDDPHTAQQARSEAERSSAVDWADRTLSTRGVSRDAARILIMQRLHVGDLTGHYLAKGGWIHVCWPMRYDPKRPDQYDPRSEPGELLWPALFDAERVRALELSLGPYGAAGQLGQAPVPEGGGLFKRSWFKIIDELPRNVRRRCRGWDTAGTEGAGDYTVGVKVAELPGPTWVIEHVVRGQWGPGEVDAVFKQTTQLDGRGCAQREEKEPGSAGKAVIAKRARDLAGIDYRGVAISGDKVTRAKPFRAQCEAGNVVLLRGEWNEAYLSELEVFPNGLHDDQVDGSSCAFNDLTTGLREVRQREVALG